MFSLQNADAGGSCRRPGWRWSRSRRESARGAQFDLDVIAVGARGRDARALTTPRTCATRATVERLAGHYARCWRPPRRDPGAPRLRAAAARRRERARLLAEAARPGRDSPPDRRRARAVRGAGGAHAGRRRAGGRRRGALDVRGAGPARQPARPPPPRAAASGPETRVGSAWSAAPELVGDAGHAEGGRRLPPARPRLPRRPHRLHAGRFRRPRAAHRSPPCSTASR